MGGGDLFAPEASSCPMNASSISIERSRPVAVPNPVATRDARDSAHRALFSAASRVLSYHAAALDAKVARIMQLPPVDGSSNPQQGMANG